MSGMCRHTGKTIEGWPYIHQSLMDIFSTRIGTRLQRRPYGSQGVELVDKPANAETALDYFVAMAEAIDSFEPRVELNSFALKNADENGNAQIFVQVTELSTGVQHSFEAVS